MANILLLRRVLKFSLSIIEKSLYKEISFLGQAIYITGRPPQPWEISVSPRNMFTDEERKIEVPNTSHVEARIIISLFKIKLY